MNGIRWLSSYKGLHLMATDAGLQTTGSSTVPLFINGDGWLQNEYYKHNAQNGFFIIETKHVEI